MNFTEVLVLLYGVGLIIVDTLTKNACLYGLSLAYLYL